MELHMATDDHILCFKCDFCRLEYNTGDVDIRCPGCGHFPEKRDSQRRLKIGVESVIVLDNQGISIDDGIFPPFEINPQPKSEDETNSKRSVGWERYGTDWPDIRDEVLQRDRHECQRCGISHEEHKKRDDLFPPGKGLHVHHITPFREFDSVDEANRLENLVALCARCHAIVESPTKSFFTG